jgi:hypothetical protein
MLFKSRNVSFKHDEKSILRISILASKKYLHKTHIERGEKYYPKC